MQQKDWDRISKNYYPEIISPLSKGVKNPLYKEIAQLKFTDYAIDLGTGLGRLLPILSKKFKTVTALDYSEGMLNHAKKYSKPNITFVKGDIRNLKDFYNKFNLAVAINSIIMPSSKEIDKSFREVFKILKKQGKFIGIFPSMESFLYYGFLTFQSELRFNSESKAKQSTIYLTDSKKFDYLFGTYDLNGKQKALYEFELILRLKKAGFKNIKIQKVVYPWKEIKDAGFGNFKKFPELWDWIVIAKN
ncbi:class I SAM-dependent methyltransferase [Candidatus Woesearchaeota archaeon]|nr:class I SAM-dependent methyltransferase [Candidatus Woesearchaeota archaeon]